jgi:hypothetical protein
MRLHHHWHVLTHLVLQHHNTKQFKFSKHIPIRKEVMVQNHKNHVIDELENQLLEIRGVMHSISDKDSVRYKRLSQQIQRLSILLDEKKK